MPYYTFKDHNTNNTFTEFMKISEMEEYRLNNPHIELLPASPPIGDPHRLGLIKPSSQFTDKLKAIKAAHKDAKINI
jgi:hypothetical protein